MSDSDKITEFEIMFALRTGVTIMVPRHEAFETSGDEELSFEVLTENASDILVKNKKKSVIIKNIQKDYLFEAKERGFVMFYELDQDEVVRCTPCHLSKS